MTQLLHFTDLHLHDDPVAEWRGVRPQQTFERTLYHARLHHWPAELVLLTGDLANEEFDDTYVRLATMAAGWASRAVAVPGNHDDTDRMRQAFEGTPITFGGIHDAGTWRVIALDSRIPGEVPGRIGTQQWSWLENAIREADGRHLLVTLHHPPLEVGSAWLDRLGLENAEGFRSLLATNGVKACLFGHAHQEHDRCIDDVRYLGTPATCVQFLPGSDDFAEDTRPPGYRWLELDDDGGIRTGVEWVGINGKEL